MKFKRAKFKVTGVTPLMHNNPQTVNPLNDYAKKLKVLTSKRTKTEDDLEEILKRELPQPVNINNKVYKFKEIGISLEEENKCTI